MPIEDDLSVQNTSSLYGNIPINNLNEWSLDKLGWYKTSKRKRSGKFFSRQRIKKYSSLDEKRNDDQVVAHTFSQIKRSLNVDVQNCAGNAHSYAVNF